MRSIWDLAIRRPVATAMFYLVVVTIGIVGLRYLPVDLLPKIEFPRLAVWVGYPNVGPEEIESIITDPLENALSGIPNLERMTSSSTEGRSVVRLTTSARRWTGCATTCHWRPRHRGSGSSIPTPGRS